MLRQKKVASAIVDREADYVLALKENQGELYEGVKDTFEQWEESAGDFFEKVEKSHGRIEKRRCWSVTDRECIEYLSDRGEWRGLSGVVMVECERVVDGVESSRKRYYISSLRADAKTMLESVRSH